MAPNEFTQDSQILILRRLGEKENLAKETKNHEEVQRIVSWKQEEKVFHKAWCAQMWTISLGGCIR